MQGCQIFKLHNLFEWFLSPYPTMSKNINPDSIDANLSEIRPKNVQLSQKSL